MSLAKFFMPVLALALTGCASYSWRSAVPEELRAVAVPVFRNASEVTGLGSVVTRQVLRELQREGTFRVTSLDDCTIEVQGEILTASAPTVAYERRTGARLREHRLTARAKVSFVDRKAGRILVDAREYTAETTFLINDDLLTGERDASGRLAEDLARQIVDDLLMAAAGNVKKEP